MNHRTEGPFESERPKATSFEAVINFYVGSITTVEGYA